MPSNQGHDAGEGRSARGLVPGPQVRGYQGEGSLVLPRPVGHQGSGGSEAPTSLSRPRGVLVAGWPVARGDIS